MCFEACVTRLVKMVLFSRSAQKLEKKLATRNVDRWDMRDGIVPGADVDVDADADADADAEPVSYS